MKLYVLLIISFIGLCSLACTPYGDIKPRTVLDAKSGPDPKKRGGEDDNEPSFTEITKTISGTLISSANVRLINGPDTLIGTTNDSGKHVFVLTRFGFWDLTITRSGYQLVHQTVNVVDSNTVRTDTMHVQ